MAQVRKTPEPSIDGRVYAEGVESELDSLCLKAIVLNDGAERFMSYLESLTVRRALLPTSSDAELRHLEGARWLVGVIRSRAQRATAKKAGQLQTPSKENRRGRRT